MLQYAGWINSRQSGHTKGYGKKIALWSYLLIYRRPALPFEQMSPFHYTCSYQLRVDGAHSLYEIRSVLAQDGFACPLKCPCSGWHYSILTSTTAVLPFFTSSIASCNAGIICEGSSIVLP